MIFCKSTVNYFCAVALVCFLAFPAIAEEPVAREAVSGIVTQIIDDGDSMILEVKRRKRSKRSKWVAVPYSDIKIGDRVSLQPGVALSNYHFKGVGRTFDKIVFSSGRQ